MKPTWREAPRRWARPGVAAGLALLCAGLGACASLVKGSAQTIAIRTDPPGAACTLTRAGLDIGDVDPTPATVSVFKSGEPILVQCRKPGYTPATTTLGAGFEGATVGNIVFGGLIGVFVDMGSGATHEYQKAVSIALIPEAFASTAARDAFFDGLRGRFLEEWNAGLRQVEAGCAEPDCARRIQAAKALRDARLQEIEQARRDAHIGMQGAAGPPARGGEPGRRP